jgi:hypothetical protein
MTMISTWTTPDRDEVAAKTEAWLEDRRSYVETAWALIDYPGKQACPQCWAVFSRRSRDGRCPKCETRLGYDGHEHIRSTGDDGSRRIVSLWDPDPLGVWLRVTILNPDSCCQSPRMPVQWSASHRDGPTTTWRRVVARTAPTNLNGRPAAQHFDYSSPCVRCGDLAFGTPETPMPGLCADCRPGAAV